MGRGSGACVVSQIASSAESVFSNASLSQDCNTRNPCARGCAALAASTCNECRDPSSSIASFCPRRQQSATHGEPEVGGETSGHPCALPSNAAGACVPPPWTSGADRARPKFTLGNGGLTAVTSPYPRSGPPLRAPALAPARGRSVDREPAVRKRSPSPRRERGSQPTAPRASSGRARCSRTAPGNCLRRSPRCPCAG